MEKTDKEETQQERNEQTEQPVEEENKLTEEEQKAKDEAGKCTSLIAWRWFLFPVDEAYLKPNWDESVDRFDDMGLKEEVLRGIYGYGFTKPSPIQMKGILPIIQGNDTIA